jgi:GT2 family glycosyltransferase
MHKSSEILSGTASLSPVLWLNEDVALFPNSVETLLKIMKDNNADIVVGQTCSKDSGISYGGYKRRSNFLPLHFERILAVTEPISSDTFNGNIVLISPHAVRTLGPFLPGYKHTLADIAYGLEATRKGLRVLVAPGFSGICEPNTNVNPSMNLNSPRRARVQALNRPSGIPIAQQWKFSIRYGGALGAVYFFSTYLRFLFTLIQYKKQVDE